MAILQATLAEEVISRQERAVIRGIFRASQLADALAMLKKVEDMMVVEPGSTALPTSGVLYPIALVTLKSYLKQAITVALVSTKVPAGPQQRGQTSETEETKV